MALTKDYKETVMTRIQSDRDFAVALYAEAISALVEGEVSEALSMLKDLVHACVTFKELSRMTNISEKSLHRILGNEGNPRLKNLSSILHAIETAMELKPEVVTFEKMKGNHKTALAFA